VYAQNDGFEFGGALPLCYPRRSTRTGRVQCQRYVAFRAKHYDLGIGTGGDEPSKDLPCRRAERLDLNSNHIRL
jgi:hypothetical protein